MSDLTTRSDDVALELSTLIDEMSAFDCRKMVKPLRDKKKTVPLSYSRVLKTDIPKGSEKQKSNVIDPNTLDIISGLDIYNQQFQTVDMEFIDMITWYYPELDKQIETRKVTGDDDYDEETVKGVKETVEDLLTEIEEETPLMEDVSVMTTCPSFCFNLAESSEIESGGTEEERREILLEPKPSSSFDTGVILKATLAESKEDSYLKELLRSSISDFKGKESDDAIDSLEEIKFSESDDILDLEIPEEGISEIKHGKRKRGRKRAALKRMLFGKPKHVP
ncbi:uncharacterized protein LOC118194589 isoform X2 [Stegodyphus dumicola]|uniref:uncharacterized protein LOC118194589 isoform X2 n=1 Tax=Stegodyphus dumicola TaxID=202533 RepID=UPI0015AC3258|nr:uncharacterized protein LOC118194589 isoform X2 [Stegodyphus dumicola]